jgi:hypothetical protein
VVLDVVGPGLHVAEPFRHVDLQHVADEILDVWTEMRRKANLKDDTRRTPSSVVVTETTLYGYTSKRLVQLVTMYILEPQ